MVICVNNIKSLICREKNEKNVIVVIIVPCKCFDHTGVHGRVIGIELKTNNKGKENTGRIIRFHKMFNKNRQAKPGANEEY